MFRAPEPGGQNLPAFPAHVVHEVAPPVLYVPAAHLVGAVVTAAAQKYPKGQERQPAVVAAGPGEYLPVPQSMQVDAPAAL